MSTNRKKRREREQRLRAQLCQQCSEAATCKAPCGRLRSWLGLQCRPMASVHHIFVGGNSDIDDMQPIIVAKVDHRAVGGMCLRDVETGDPWPRRPERVRKHEKTGRTVREWNLGGAHACEECAQFRKPKWCQWMDGEIKPDDRADGCAGWDRKV